MRRRIFSAILTLAVLISTFLPSLAYAATQDRAVTGEGGVTCGTYSGGNWAIMNDSSDVDYLSGNPWVSPCNHTYDMTDFVTGHTAINSVMASARIRLGDSYGTYSNGTSYIICRVGGTVYTGSAISPTMSFTTYTYTWSTNPATGTAWTQTTLNAAEFGIQLGYAPVWLGGGSWDYYPHRCSELKITVDYNPPVVPTVTATAPTTYNHISATLIGNITATGGETPDNYGFVWDTADEGDPGNVAPSPAPGAWANGWAVGAGSYPVGQYTHATGNTLTKNTTYYIRFAAHNSVGWKYSSAVSFKTIADPTVGTAAATLVGSTTARLNAEVTSDGKVGGGEECTVTFIYKAGNYADYASILAAGGTEVAASGTYNQGEYPYVNIGSLTVSTQYSFAVKIVNVTTTSAYGVRLYFSTNSGVFEPTNFGAIPSGTVCSLSWIKSSGVPLTLVRYQTGAYPTSTSEGTLAYLGNSNSVQLSGLVPGTTYFASAWGLDASVYSTGYETVMWTQLASDTTGSTSLTTPPAYEPWNQTPSASKASQWPLIGGLVAVDSATYGTDENWLWYLLTIFVATGIGVVLYDRANFNLPMSAAGAAVVLAGGAVAFELIMLWIAVAFIIIFAGFSMFGERR